MKLRITIGLVAVLIGFLSRGSGAAEIDYYQRLASLFDTNHFGPPLTNGILLLSRLKQSGEIAGVRLGTGMSRAVELWGMPRSLMSNCGGGPILSFGHGALNFRGDKVIRISLFPNTIPGLRFEGGLTVTNTPAEFAKALGLPPPGPNEWYLAFDSKAGVIRLEWVGFAVGGWQLASLELKVPESARDQAPNPQGGANGRQPFSSEANRASAAAASRRSP